MLYLFICALEMLFMLKIKKKCIFNVYPLPFPNFEELPKEAQGRILFAVAYTVSGIFSLLLMLSF